MKTWLDTFLEEKGLGDNLILSIETEHGFERMALGYLNDHIVHEPQYVQDDIKLVLDALAHADSPIIPYLRQLARAIAI